MKTIGRQKLEEALENPCPSSCWVPDKEYKCSWPKDHVGNHSHKSSGIWWLRDEVRCEVCGCSRCEPQ